MAAKGGHCEKHGLTWFGDLPCPDCAGATSQSDEPPPGYTALFYRPASLMAPETDPRFDVYPNAEVSILVDRCSEIALEPEPYVGPCPGTFGMQPCTEILKETDRVNGKTVCWRCSWHQA